MAPGRQPHLSNEDILLVLKDYDIFDSKTHRIKSRKKGSKHEKFWDEILAKLRHQVGRDNLYLRLSGDRKGILTEYKQIRGIPLDDKSDDENDFFT